MAKQVLPKYLNELSTPAVLPIQQGDTGYAVKRVQEWLCFHGFNVVVDCDFGPATAAATAAFQRTAGVGDPRSATGIVDTTTWGALSLPIIRATVVPPLQDKTFGEAIYRVARPYMVEGAREIGGDNRGMWQRHFSRGRENQPWCQDFATTVYMDAARNFKLTELPFDLTPAGTSLPSSYVPWVANAALENGRLVRGDSGQAIAQGSMFFVKQAGDVPYRHVGIVTEDHGDHFTTIEGNSNTDGSDNGFEVVVHYRSRASCDFGICS